MSGNRSTSTAVDEDSTITWSAELLVAEVDSFGFDPDMDNESESIDGAISTARSPINETLTVGSGDCRVDMSITVTADYTS